VEGYHAVHELLVAGRRRVRQLWVCESSSHNVSHLAQAAATRGLSAVRQPAEVVNEVSRTGAHQGVIAWAEPVPAVPLGSLFGMEPTTTPFLVVLDGVTDPGNFGAILRSAACAGVTGVVIGKHRSAPLTPAAVKAAAGAVEWVPIAEAAGIAGSIAQLGRAGIWAIGLDPSAREAIWQAPVLDGPVALVLGAEGRGLSPLVRQRCDALVKVPQIGPLGSLNVAAAAAVGCFEVARRRSGS